MEDLADENLHLGVACGRSRSLRAQTRGGWSDLHEDVLYQVMCRLPSIQDCLSLAAVSHHWRGAVYLRLPCSLPKLCLALPDGTFYTFQAGDSSVLKRRDDLRHGSYCGATGSQLLSSSDGCSVYRLVNPFTGRDRLLPVPYGIPVPAHDVIVVHEPTDAEEDQLLIEEELPVRKLVFGPDGLVAAIVGHREHSAKVALSASWSWSIDAGDSWRWYVDMAFFDGNLYALTNDGNLLALEVSYDGGAGEPRISNVQQVIHGGTCNPYALQEYTGARYLVARPSGRGLLMVCRIMLDQDQGMTTYDFAVFQADLGSSSWVQVNTLGGGDEALFVGRLCSRAVRADRHGVRGDQIFFLDDSAGTQQRLCDAFANVYDMKHGNITELLTMHSHGDDAEVPATWLFREDADAEE